jgi:hypothetical protein
MSASSLRTAQQVLVDRIVLACESNGIHLDEVHLTRVKELPHKYLAKLWDQIESLTDNGKAARYGAVDNVSQIYLNDSADESRSDQGGYRRD